MACAGDFLGVAAGILGVVEGMRHGDKLGAEAFDLLLDGGPNVEQSARAV